MKKIVLISCVSRKRTTKSKARELYKGSLFTSSLAYGISLNPDKIFILSALHKLLNLDTEIEPYNVTLSNIPKSKRKGDLKILTAKEKIEWGKKIIEQLKDQADIQKDEFIILAGKEYIKPIEGFFVNNNLKNPLEGKRVGERIKFLQNKINYVR